MNELINKQEELDTLKMTHNSLSEKFNLISNILSAKPNSDPGVQKFKYLLYGDFLEFANEESSLAEEAKAILIMQSIEKDLQLIIDFPAVYNKNKIAIGGGFSSGKSAFVNSFFDTNDIKLPIGIEPVTAIPTYVVSSTDNSIKGHSSKGGSVEIEQKFYEHLSHNFVKSLNFNLKDIMPFITIGTPLKPEYFKNVCLIDTPGYDPALADGFTDEDKKTAFEYLEQADSLIWMIGLDSGGTFPASDLNFLSELDLTSKKLFIVANKAELRSESDLESILDEIQENLEDFDIPFYGISAFSSMTHQEYLFKKNSLFKFLKVENKKTVQIQNKIINNIDTVFDMYKKAIEQDISRVGKMKRSVKSLEIDLLQLGYDSDESQISNRIEFLKKSLSINELKNHLSKLEKIREQMLTAIYGVSGINRRSRKHSSPSKPSRPKKAAKRLTKEQQQQLPPKKAARPLTKKQQQQLLQKKWRALLKAQRKSGMTVAAFCFQESLSESTFYRWRKRLQRPVTKQSLSLQELLDQFI